jgi:N4-gp56 family major capsid protein
MAKTNFAALTTSEKKVWSLQFWKMARNASFIHQFSGSGPNAMVQRITELTKTEKGDKAVLTLIADLTGDGVMGDADLEGSEEAIKAYDTEIQIDQMRNGNRTTGRMADQKSVVTFRGTSRDQLAYWFADRMDQLAFLSLAGISYLNTNRGDARPVLAAGKNFNDLSFAAAVTAPSSARHLRWDSASSDLAVGATASMIAGDTLTYKALVLAKAEAKNQYIRGIKGPGGEEIYHVFVTPDAMAKLKLDPDYLANVRSAGVRGGKNPLFAGTTSVMVDGLVIHEYRHVYNTKGLATSSKWGATGTVDGSRVAICGAQALGMADLGEAGWMEKEFDYGNQRGIATDKILGFLKPQFHSNVTGDVQDFGVLSLDVSI